MLTSLFITRRHSISEGARAGTSSSVRGPRFCRGDARAPRATALDACVDGCSVLSAQSVTLPRRPAARWEQAWQRPTITPAPNRRPRTPGEHRPERCRARRNLPVDIWAEVWKKASAAAAATVFQAWLRCSRPRQPATPGSLRRENRVEVPGIPASRHGAALVAVGGYGQSRGMQGGTRRQPGDAEPGRKPLQEGSSGLTNKSLTASPEAGGRKQVPWL